MITMTAPSLIGTGPQAPAQSAAPQTLLDLTAHLGDEIASMKEKSGGFAPHAERPDAIIHKLRSDLPLWVLCSVFGLICILGYVGLRASLAKTSADRMNAYNDVVKLAPKSANLTITLP